MMVLGYFSAEGLARGRSSGGVFVGLGPVADSHGPHIVPILYIP